MARGLKRVLVFTCVQCIQGLPRMVITRFRKHALYWRAYYQQLRIRSADASTER